MSKIKSIKIEEDGKELEKSGDYYIKYDEKKVKVVWDEGEISIKIKDYKKGKIEVKDVKFSGSVMTFRYEGDWDVASDSEEEKVETVNRKYKITFAAEADCKAVEKVFSK